VTRFGEFSPVGLSFTRAVFWKIREVANIFGLLFSSAKFMHLVFTKRGWDTFWAIFSQTHLVTLLRERQQKNGLRFGTEKNAICISD
jgi:hypothetical protein